MKKILVFIADGTEEVEVITVVDYLRRAKVEVDLVSVMADLEVTGAHGVRIVADKFIQDIDSKDYDAVYSPGGLPGAYHIRDSKEVIEIYREMYSDGKITSALCAAPIVLDEAGILEDKNVTSYPGFEKELRSGNYKEDIVVVDSNIITGRGPAIAAVLAFELIEQLCCKDIRKQVEEATLFSMLLKSYK